MKVNSRLYRRRAPDLNTPVGTVIRRSQTLIALLTPSRTLVSQGSLSFIQGCSPEKTHFGDQLYSRQLFFALGSDPGRRTIPAAIRMDSLVFEWLNSPKITWNNTGGRAVSFLSQTAVIFSIRVVVAKHAGVFWIAVRVFCTSPRLKFRKLACVHWLALSLFSEGIL